MTDSAEPTTTNWAAQNLFSKKLRLLHKITHWLQEVGFFFSLECGTEIPRTAVLIYLLESPKVGRSKPKKNTTHTLLPPPNQTESNSGRGSLAQFFKYEAIPVTPQCCFSYYITLMAALFLFFFSFFFFLSYNTKRNGKKQKPRWWWW